MAAKLVGGGLRHQVAMEALAAGGARNGAVGADDPEIEAEHFGDRHRESMTAAGDQHGLDAGIVGTAQRIQIGLRDLGLGVQQGAVNIDGDEAYGAQYGHCSSASGRPLSGGKRELMKIRLRRSQNWGGVPGRSSELMPSQMLLSTLRFPLPSSLTVQTVS